MSDQPWLTTLITDTPQAGFELAVTLSRRGVKTTQPDVEVLKKLRSVYANDAKPSLPPTTTGAAKAKRQRPSESAAAFSDGLFSSAKNC